MVEKLIFFSAFGLAALCWLLAVQMRAFTAQALYLAAQDRFRDMAGSDVKAAAKLSPLAARPDGVVSSVAEVADWLRDTYPQAVRHLAIARKASMIAPVVLLVLAAVWRFGFGGF